MAPLRLRAMQAVWFGAVVGGACGFISSAVGSYVFWHVYHMSTAAQSWDELWAVALTNALWMTVEGATTAWWLTAWAALRESGAGPARRMIVILCFVVLNIASQRVPGFVMETMRARYVVLLHEAFSLTLGAIGIWEPASRHLRARFLAALVQASAVSLLMGLLLFALGNWTVIVVGNFFYWMPCAFGILAGAHWGQSVADRAWARSTAGGHFPHPS